MTDLFGDTCPCCGQALPQEAQASPFETFWQDVPHKVGKEAARKAWGKLSPADRQAAHDRLKGWYSWFAKAHPQASTIHPASYLNGRRWEDEVSSQPKTLPRAHRLAKSAEDIRSGKRFLCTQIPASVARECMDNGLVTEAECKAVGVI